MKFYFLIELTKMMFILCALAFISNYSKGGFIAKKKKRKEKKRKYKASWNQNLKKNKTII